jgi:site-specific recombinase XerD
LRVIQGTVTERRTTPLEEAYAHFRLGRQGLPVSPATLRLYEHTVGRFLRWVRTEHPEVRRFEDLDVMVVRQYRADLASRPGLRRKPIQPETLSGADRALRTFFRWAAAEGYPVAPRILQLPKVRVPWKEPTLFHVSQLREIVAACNPRMPPCEGRPSFAAERPASGCGDGAAGGAGRHEPSWCAPCAWSASSPSRSGRGR